ncbi:MAG TPA: DUF72 domain-containing protein [Gemmatimonadales bacterium]|nr:DUF72 domain-containing protein [Gemmatimonadales bacterium]
MATRRAGKPSHPPAGPAARIHLGTQGWDYPAWVGPFYPAGTKPPDFLSVYARAFDTVEVDSTYHAAPAEHVVRGWAEKVPAGFRFALKLPQELTPEAAPADAQGLAAFAARAALLGEKLGPVLVQLGPEFGPERWEAVVALLAALPSGLRWAVEFRHKGWVGPKLLDLLGRHGVALALVEGRWLRRDETIDLAIRPTADFAYVRWIGTGPRMEDVASVQVNRDRELSVWAVALAALAARVPVVYGYFANHFQGHAPASVREMQRLIGGRPVEPAKLGSQTSLF